MRQRRQPEIIAGRVNADGSIAAGDGFTVQKTGTGAYTVTTPLRMVATTASAHGNIVAAPSGYGSNSVSITTYTPSTGAVTDFPFSFTAVGVQQ